jgi:ribosomal protein S27AE
MLPGRTFKPCGTSVMIVKNREDAPLPEDPLLRAGVLAERQMAHYLHRAFARGPSVYVLNDLRLVDPDQPEHDGCAGAAQIDHLVLHRWGGFIIESKSVTDEVRVRPDGAGGDEWTRMFRGRERGFPSPIQQARRQGELLRAFLNARCERLLGRVAVGLRTIAKVIGGSDQRTFRTMPLQIIVAISDQGKITRSAGWREPDRPFRAFVSKADLVPDRIREELAAHRAGASPLSDQKTQYGVWSMKDEELTAVASFLVAYHTPLPIAASARADLAAVSLPEPAPPPVRSTPPAREPACKKCGDGSLVAMWGQYGYYWKCARCGTNTAMPVVCSACGAQGHHGRGVRIRKEGPSYYRVCDACAVEERMWTQPEQH